MAIKTIQIEGKRVVHHLQKETQQYNKWIEIL